MDGVSSAVPWIMGAIAVVIAGLIVYIIIRCAFAMKKARELENGMKNRVHIKVELKVCETRSKRKIDVGGLDYINEDDIYIVANVDGERKKLDILMSVFENLEEGMSGTAELVKDKIVSFTPDSK